MAEVVIHTKDSCPCCDWAKALMDEKGVVYEEVSATEDPAREREMIEMSGGGRRTALRVFIDGQGIGGSDDLHALDQEGKLDPLLGPSRR